MYQEAFTKLESPEIETILEQVNPHVEGSAFESGDTTIMALDLSFYPGYRLLEISDHTVSPAVMRHAVCSKDDVVVLNWSNEPIYALNAKLPIQLNEENVTDYAIFFLSYVRGKHGRFLVVQNVDDIAWKEEPPAPARKAIGDMLEPVSVVEQGNDGGFFLKATVVFKDSLFKTDIYIEADGQVNISNEELLVEDMPVIDDSFGQ